MLSYREKHNPIHSTEYEEAELLPQPLPVSASICSLKLTPIGNLSVQSGDCVARRLQDIQVLHLGAACVNPEPSSITHWDCVRANIPRLPRHWKKEMPKGCVVKRGLRHRQEAKKKI